MAEVRYIKTKIWRDSWFSTLGLKEQNLYMFIVTNEATRLSGYYEMPLKHIAMYTQLTEKELPKVLEGIKTRVAYYKGWVCIKNYAQHQNASNSPKVQTLIDREMEKVPREVIEFATSQFTIPIHNSNSVGIDTPSIPYKKEENVDKHVENVKKTYGEFKNVKLTDDEKEKLKEKYGYSVAKKLVNDLDTYLESTGKKKYKSHYATMLAWARRAGIVMNKPPTKQEPETEMDEEQRQKNLKLLAKMREDMSKKFKANKHE